MSLYCLECGEASEAGRVCPECGFICGNCVAAHRCDLSDDLGETSDFTRDALADQDGEYDLTPTEEYGLAQPQEDSYD